MHPLDGVGTLNPALVSQANARPAVGNAEPRARGTEQTSPVSQVTPVGREDTSFKPVTSPQRANDSETNMRQDTRARQGNGHLDTYL